LQVDEIDGLWRAGRMYSLSRAMNFRKLTSLAVGVSCAEKRNEQIASRSRMQSRVESQTDAPKKFALPSSSLEETSTHRTRSQETTLGTEHPLEVMNVYAHVRDRP